MKLELLPFAVSYKGKGDLDLVQSETLASLKQMHEWVGDLFPILKDLGAVFQPVVMKFEKEKDKQHHICMVKINCVVDTKHEGKLKCLNGKHYANEQLKTLGLNYQLKVLSSEMIVGKKFQIPAEKKKGK